MILVKILLYSVHLNTLAVGFWLKPRSKNMVHAKPCGLYYKPITIVNDTSRVINKLKTSLTGNVRVVIYDCHMFIEQATSSACMLSLFALSHTKKF